MWLKRGMKWITRACPKVDPIASGRWSRSLDALWIDLRFAARALRRAPGFSLACLLTIALGLGSTAAIYAVAEAVVFRPLPFPEESRLAWIWSTRPDRDRAFFSIPDFLDLQRANESLAGLAAVTPLGFHLTGRGEPERVHGWRVTPNLFAVLGTSAHLGRLPAAGEDTPVALLGHGYWQRRFGGDPRVVGSTLVLNGAPHVVAGILPRTFQIPTWDTDVVVAQPLETDARASDRGTNFLRGIARLKPGFTLAAAQAEFAELNARLVRQYPATNGTVAAPRFVRLRDEVTGGYRGSLLLLLGAVGLLLVIMASNLAGLQAARSLARQRDAALCTALGASPRRLARAALLEGLLLALGGGGLGFLACQAGLPALLALAPADLPRVGEVALDSRVALACLGCSLLAGLVIGLGPAFRFARATPLAALQRHLGGGNVRTLWRSLLVAAQIALGTTLLVGTGLLVRSLAHLLQARPGFVADGVLTAQVALASSEYRTVPAVTSFVDAVTARLRQLPGVTSASSTSVLPLTGINTRSEFTRPDKPPARPSDFHSAANRFIGEDCFAALGIPLLSGRDFRPTDDADGQPVVIIDQSLAARFWPGEEPLGKSILLRTNGLPQELHIVGVVGPTKNFSLEEAGTPTLYLPARQMAAWNLPFYVGRLLFVVRTEGDPLALKEAAGRAIRSVDANAAVVPRTLEEATAWARAARVFSLRLLGFFCGAAILLAGLGLYAVTAQSVASRTRELGIRLALGEAPRALLRRTLAESGRWALLGIGAGLVLAAALAPLLRGMLHGVPGFDVLTYGLVAAGFLLLALLAAWLPARRAARLDPVTALRAE